MLVVAPASAAADPKARYGDTMVIGITGDPGTLNGTTSSNFVEKIIASNVFSMLIRLDTSFKPVPDLAKSWTISDDGLTYTFKLNEASSGTMGSRSAPPMSSTRSTK
jgi:peptide/nickel transport system substrate-binding protein